MRAQRQPCDSGRDSRLPGQRLLTTIRKRFKDYCITKPDQDNFNLSPQLSGYQGDNLIYRHLTPLAISQF